MVRVNLVNPKTLSDQHLIAEYNEILMLVAYIKKYPGLEGIPSCYCLGEGHMKFFKNKVNYLKKRHELIKIEMKKRGFAATKKISFNPSKAQIIWKPKSKDYGVIIQRLKYKLNKKPNYYRYYGEKKSKRFFINMLR